MKFCTYSEEGFPSMWDSTNPIYTNIVGDEVYFSSGNEGRTSYSSLLNIGSSSETVVGLESRDSSLAYIGYNINTYNIYSAPTYGGTWSTIANFADGPMYAYEGRFSGLRYVVFQSGSDVKIGRTFTSEGAGPGVIGTVEDVRLVGTAQIYGLWCLVLLYPDNYIELIDLESDDLIEEYYVGDGVVNTILGCVTYSPTRLVLVSEIDPNIEAPDSNIVGNYLRLHVIDFDFVDGDISVQKISDINLNRENPSIVRPAPVNYTIQDIVAITSKRPNIGGQSDIRIAFNNPPYELSGILNTGRSPEYIDNAYAQLYVVLAGEVPTSPQYGHTPQSTYTTYTIVVGGDYCSNPQPGTVPVLITSDLYGTINGKHMDEFNYTYNNAADAYVIELIDINSDFMYEEGSTSLIIYSQGYTIDLHIVNSCVLG